MQGAIWVAVTFALADVSGSVEQFIQYEPAINVRQVVSPGTVMLKSYPMSVSTYAKATTVGDFADAFGLARVKMIVPDGTVLEKTDRGFCAVGVYPIGAVCFLGTESGIFDRFQMSAGGGSYRLHSPLRYQAAGTGQSGGNTGEFANTITYLGVASGTIRLSYREFSQGMARPAFTEDLTFDRPDKFPATIAVKGYKIVIESVDNSGLAYKVLSNP